MRVPTEPVDGSAGEVAGSIGSDSESVLALLPAALPELPPVGRMGVGAIRSAGLRLLTFMIRLAFNKDEGIEAASR
jgi:hypothetical protein